MIPVYFSHNYIPSSSRSTLSLKSQWVADEIQARFGDRTELVDPGLFYEFEQIHSPDYVSAIRNGQPHSLAQSHGIAWEAELWTISQAMNAGIVQAALASLEHGVAGSLSTGFHHARREAGDLYCVFNGLALAARAALNAGVRRVLILDLNAHCGGGTHSLIQGDSRGCPTNS